MNNNVAKVDMYPEINAIFEEFWGEKTQDCIAISKEASRILSVKIHDGVLALKAKEIDNLLKENKELREQIWDMEHPLTGQI